MNLEAVLDVIGCKTRRDILALLTEEPRFVSQLSQQLNVGQKAIIGHLKAMEELGLINPKYQKIERGRPRKYYEINITEKITSEQKFQIIADVIQFALLNFD
jgi:ArsR family transcriptional regulator